MSFGKWNLFLLVLTLISLGSLDALTLNDEEVQSYINALAAEFDKNPRDSKFTSIITPPVCLTASRKGKFLLPKVFIWSPCEQFADLKIECPAHNGVMLKPWQWAKDVRNKQRGKVPRMVYDLYGNVILIQKIYVCVRGRSCHKLMPTTPDVHHRLPKVITEYFPLVLTERSGYTKSLLDFIEVQLFEGVNFLKISEGIASLNIREFCRRRQIYKLSLEETTSENTSMRAQIDISEFYEMPIFSHPSNDMLMNIFLQNFDKQSHLYEECMNRLTAKVITCDHTFKISRNIGIVRETDNKFVPQYKQVFIALNEQGEVLGWRLTKTTSFSEIEDLLQGIKKRLERNVENLNMICVDDCCHVRNKYNKIFPDTLVKLDLFHACQRVTKTVNKADAIGNSFMHDFSQVFRRDEDQGSTRLQNTPGVKQLEKNLNSFLERWMNVPNGPLGNLQTTREIESLRLHIQKGCLSDIPPGCGTERNEHLHRLLNRSLITGSTRISVQLAIALLTILFYYHSSKSSAVHHVGNSRVAPLVPIAYIDNIGKDVDPFPHCRRSNDLTWAKTEEIRDDPVSEAVLNPEIVMTETITDLCTDYVAGTIINVAFNLQGIINNVGAQSRNRAFNSINLLQLSKLSNLLSFDDTAEIDDPNINTHTEDLKRHLAGFGLEIDGIDEDGDCAFRSIVRQLSKIDLNKYKELQDHLLSLNLFSGFEDGDTFTLRQLFVEELLKGQNEFSVFVSETTRSFTEKANEFKNRGVFDREIGDLTMKVCSNVLKIPVIVITSNRSTPVVPFMPDQPLCQTPIYVAYHYYGAGHYDATNSKRDPGMLFYVGRIR